MMFSALSSAIGYLFGGSQQESVVESSSVVDSAAASTNSSSEPSKKPKTVNVRGSVTALHNGYGIIDRTIYFTFNDCVGNVRPKIGDEVNVTAYREGDDGGWRAKTVYPSNNNQWDDQQMEDIDDKQEEDEESNVTTSVVGMVTSTSRDGGIVNDFISFVCEDVRSGYVPYRGDWIIGNQRKNDDSHATEIRPAREIQFTGEVNSVQTGFGYIDKEIYFQFSACFDGYSPRRGDEVAGTAIESSQGRCNWRAISVRAKTVTNKRGIPLTLLKSPTESKFQQQLLANKQGVSITNNGDFGRLSVATKKTTTFWIRNDGKKTQKFVRAILKSSTCTQFTIASPRILPRTHIPVEREIDLFPGMTIHITAECIAKNCGVDRQLLLFEFADFKIGRYLSASVFDPIQTSLESNEPYQRRVTSYNRYKSQNTEESCIIPGQRPLRFSGVKLPNKLPQYPIPIGLKMCCLEHEDLLPVAPELIQPLCMENYVNKFSALLHLEEIQMEVDIREFDLERECMRRCGGDLLGLKVPGLAEGRPSVLVGDRVIISEPGDDVNSPMYEGYIHEVLFDEVLLKFNPNFHSNYQGEDYNVMFTFSRTPMRRCHQAVRFVSQLGIDVLFPTRLVPKLPQVMGKSETFSEAVVKPLVAPSSGSRRNSTSSCRSTSSSHQFFNSNLNERQKSAVIRILGGQSRPTPYILFGPPGTGKTVTLVEAILQIFCHVSGSRVLACAPSNSAADLLAERLILSGKIKQGDLIRLNAFSRGVENIPEVVQSYSSTGDDLELAARYRIIICTCTTAGSFFSIRINPGHFTHAIIDEAGQATEPECVTVMSLVANAGGQTVLAGDPMQLGPVLRSNAAKEYGLQQSLLERLINTDLYQRDESKFADHGSYDPLLVTKLVNNYRSHPAILNVSSELFYHNELVVCADKRMIESMCDWEELPCKNFPVIFHGMRGEDMREGNSPSWFNPVEAVQVMRYLQSLVRNPHFELSYDAIGIVTPYRKQVEKIRLLIDRLGMDKVKVGSVEEFQGQERPVIIISTVRANESNVNFDHKYNLGFLSNPKRFNVSISRAQALLVIIGNPYVLGQDPVWFHLLQYCVKHGAYTGCDLPPFSGLCEDKIETNCNDNSSLQSSDIGTVKIRESADNDTNKQNAQNLTESSVADGSSILEGTRRIGGCKDVLDSSDNQEVEPPVIIEASINTTDSIDNIIATSMDDLCSSSNTTTTTSDSALTTSMEDIHSISYSCTTAASLDSLEDDRSFDGKLCVVSLEALADSPGVNNTEKDISNDPLKKVDYAFIEKQQPNRTQNPQTLFAMLGLPDIYPNDISFKKTKNNASPSFSDDRMNTNNESLKKDIVDDIASEQALDVVDGITAQINISDQDSSNSRGVNMLENISYSRPTHELSNSQKTQRQSNVHGRGKDFQNLAYRSMPGHNTEHLPGRNNLLKSHNVQQMPSTCTVKRGDIMCEFYEDDDMEQRDSDVVIESDTEEFLE
ncbi:RNA helicase Mov10l1-like [Tubulanus polymorphus]|uniref:RNA helicase Mov10l1-like n=1 Tax=Tubulanus polymorphus TaxID=672921 RepID=UPI003DA47FDE